MKTPGQPLPLGRGVERIEAHPCGLLALYKPPGVLSHPNRRGEEKKALLTVPYDDRAECWRWEADGTQQVLYLLNRLDSPTSGLVLCATEEEAAEALRAAFRAHAVEKTYYAVVKGDARRAGGFWKDRLGVAKKGGAVRATGGATEATASMKCLRTRAQPLLSLIELRPGTGRTHQLRAQCQRRNLPIAGDGTYGDFAFNKLLRQQLGWKRLALHAAGVRWEGTVAGEKVRFAVAPVVPEDFAALVPLA